MKEKKKLSLGAWIMIGLAAGIAVGAILWAAMGAENATNFTASYLKPFGDIFVNLLKFIVVPLVLLSIMDGMFSMGDIGFCKFCCKIKRICKPCFIISSESPAFSSYQIPV